MTRPGDDINIGDDVGNGQDMGVWGKLVSLGHDGVAEFYVVKKYEDGDTLGNPTGEKIRSRFVFPTEWDM